jgi:hypothetical protein
VRFPVLVRVGDAGCVVKRFGSQLSTALAGPQLGGIWVNSPAAQTDEDSKGAALGGDGSSRPEDGLDQVGASAMSESLNVGWDDGQIDPIYVKRGEALTRGSDIEWPDFVSSLLPAADLLADLEQELAEAEEADYNLGCMMYGEMGGEVLDGQVFDVGNTVNGQPWVWCLIDDRWWLLPAAITSWKSTVFEIFQDFDDMVDGGMKMGCRYVPPVVLRYWSYWGEESDGVQASIILDSDGSGVIDAVADAVSQFTECFSFCPECEDFDFRLDAEIPDPVPLEVVADALATVWQLCEKHTSAGPFDAADRKWRWDGNGWSVIADT